MEAELQAARLLTWRAAKMINAGTPNSLEASMAKAKAGLAVVEDGPIPGSIDNANQTARLLVLKPTSAATSGRRRRGA